MQRYVGIVRTDARLAKAADAVDALRKESKALLEGPLLADDALELRNMLDVGALIIQCARMRHESRGLNYNTDYPETSDSERHETVVQNK